MRLRSRVASIAFKCLIVLVGAVGLLDQLGLFEGSFNPRFFFYFTNLSNAVAVAYFIGAIVHLVRHPGDGAAWAPRLKYAALMAVTVTCLVATFLLGGGVRLPASRCSPCTTSCPSAASSTGCCSTRRAA